MTVHHAACPACAGTDIRENLRIRDHSVSGEVFPVWHCMHCHLKFTQDAPDSASIGKYYQSEAYVSHTETRKGLVNRLYHAVRAHTLQQKRTLVSVGVTSASPAILDYGCGTGAFLKVMKEAGWAATGLEPDPLARQNARQLHGIDAESPDRLSTIADDTFDVITLWHVLEHVHELQTTLDHLKRVLKPGGAMYIAVPNHKSSDALHYGGSWAAWDVPRHLYHFSPDALRALMQRKGLTVTHTLPMWFDAFYVSLLSEKYRKSGILGYPAALLQGLVSNMTAWMNRERCSSVIYVVRHA
jgi:2-polyprenyl-3-methyl-5-hydroxy-6-metoxy-1,4-benzoquinol methylase